MTLILGTSSSFRRSFFKIAFKDFLIKDESIQFLTPDIDEKAIRHSDPYVLCQKIAIAKCDAIVEKYGKVLPENAIVLTFDQIVVCNNEIREKPIDTGELRRFHQSYREGQPARALSGIVAHNIRNGKRQVLLDEISITFAEFPDRVVEHLIQDKIVFKASGGFTVDDRELGKYIKVMDGSRDAMEGLPVEKLQKAVRAVTEEIEFLPVPKLAAITHVIFDMDGLLLDTESLYSIAQQKMLDPYGIKFTYEVKSMMMGKKGLEAIEIMLKHYNLENDPAEFYQNREEILDELFQDCDLMPGALRLVKHLKKHQIPMAIATSSHKRHFDLKTLKHKELFKEMFQAVITGDEVVHSKPNPEIFVKAAETLAGGEGYNPAHYLVMEDSPLGVKGSIQAGMPVVWVYDVNEPTEDLNATQSMKSLMHFVPEQFGLPPYDK